MGLRKIQEEPSFEKRALTFGEKSGLLLVGGGLSVEGDLVDEDLEEDGTVGLYI